MEPELLSLRCGSIRTVVQFVISLVARRQFAQGVLYLSRRGFRRSLDLCRGLFARLDTRSLRLNIVVCPFRDAAEIQSPRPN